MTDQNYGLGGGNTTHAGPMATPAPESALQRDKRQTDQLPLCFDTEEIWKPVVGFEGRYEVSSLGRIKALPSTSYLNERIRKTAINNRGYEVVSLWLPCRMRSLLVHRAVAIAFILNPENLPEVNHIDGDKLNNKLSNLEWVSSAKNKAHSLEKGLRGGVSPETTEQILQEYHTRKSTYSTAASIAEKYGLSKFTVRYIVSKSRKASRQANNSTHQTSPSHE